MRLTFANNEFVLQYDCTDRRPTLSYAWNLVSRSFSFTYATKNIKAAAEFRKHADSIAERIFNRHMLKTVALPTGGVLSPKDLTLYPFQKDRGVPHILCHNKSYLAHQPGLGKSAQAICAVASKPGRAFIVCPAFLRVTWAREITKWFHRDFPTIEIVPESSKRHEVNWNADFLIVPDSMLQRPWVGQGLLKQKFKFGFADEAHRYKVPDATRTTALFGGRNNKIISPGLIYNVEHFCLMSGTPLLGRAIELWPALYAMAPELIDFMPYADFGFRYGGPVMNERGQWNFVGSCNEQELHDKIMGRFMQYIRKEDVLKDLPPKVREVVLIDKDTRTHDVKVLDQALMREMSRKELDKPDSLGEYAALRHENGLAKVQFTAEFVHNIMSSDVNEQIILYAHHIDVVEGLRSALHTWNPMVIRGGTPLSLRTEFQDLFQEGRRRLIIGNISSMNLGLTLTKASRIVFAEYDWTPALNEQAEDRAHRIGQHDSVLCQYLALPNSFDEIMLNSVFRKMKVFKKVIG